MKNTRQVQVRAYAVVVFWSYRLEVFKHTRQGKQLKIDQFQYPRALYVLIQKACTCVCPRTEHGILHARIQSYGVLHNTPHACAIELTQSIVRGPAFL
jgi:hypothetical protein